MVASVANAGGWGVAIGAGEKVRGRVPGLGARGLGRGGNR
jgi:hypothetical protein